MKYFKVIPQFDNRPLYKKRKSEKEPLVPNGYYLVANELFTAYEVAKMNIPYKYLEEVNVKKTDTYFLFGARFHK